jgi:hypothetical protein
MSAIHAVLFVLCDQWRRDLDAGCGASPMPARVPACAGRQESGRGVGIGRW